MLQRVYRQIQKIDASARVTVATSRSQVSAIHNQLGDRVAVSVEPCRKDTFPAIALATAYLVDVLKVDENEPVVVCPVDPYVGDDYFEALRSLARQAARGLLLEHPDINVLVGFNEPLAVGTAQAVDELELNGQVREIAFDTNPVCVELLQKGAVSALIVQNPYAMGYLGVETAWRSLQGERFDASSLINTPTTTITRETMFTIESQKAIFSFD